MVAYDENDIESTQLRTRINQLVEQIIEDDKEGDNIYLLVHDARMRLRNSPVASLLAKHNVLSRTIGVLAQCDKVVIVHTVSNFDNSVLSEYRNKKMEREKSYVFHHVLVTSLSPFIMGSFVAGF